MDSLVIAGIVFSCTFGGALFVMRLRRILPESHLSSEPKDVVKMGTGLLATLSALVLGLRIPLGVPNDSPHPPSAGRNYYRPADASCLIGPLVTR